MADRICTEDNCGKPHCAKGLCSMHLARVRRNGSLDPKQIQGDDEARFFASSKRLENGCREWAASLTAGGYGRFVTGGVGSSLAHRWSYEHWNGPIPDKFVIERTCHVHPDGEECPKGRKCIFNRCVEHKHLIAVESLKGPRQFLRDTTINRTRKPRYRPPCALEGCSRTSTISGYCDTHRARIDKFGTPGSAEIKTQLTEPIECIADNCDNKAGRQKYCRSHLYRLNTYGDPNATLLRKNRKKRTRYNVNGYVQILVDGKYVREHRHVMEQAIGRKLLRTEYIHHLDGQKDNNDLLNLEIWNSPQMPGQRAGDLIAFAKSILTLYSDPRVQPFLDKRHLDVKINTETPKK